MADEAEVGIAWEDCCNRLASSHDVRDLDGDPRLLLSRNLAGCCFVASIFPCCRSPAAWQPRRGVVARPLGEIPSRLGGSTRCGTRGLAGSMGNAFFVLDAGTNLEITVVEPHVLMACELCGGQLDDDEVEDLEFQ